MKSRNVEVVPMFACTSTSETPDMKVQLFKEAKFCVISEHVVRDRLDITQVNMTQARNITLSCGTEVRTLGQLELAFSLATPEGLVWSEATFEVISISYVRDYDAALSDVVICGLGSIVEEAIQHANGDKR